jgi:hypothetical protein
MKSYFKWLQGTSYCVCNAHATDNRIPSIGWANLALDLSIWVKCIQPFTIAKKQHFHCVSTGNCKCILHIVKWVANSSHLCNNQDRLVIVMSQSDFEEVKLVLLKVSVGVTSHKSVSFGNVDCCCEHLSQIWDSWLVGTRASGNNSEQIGCLGCV